MRIDIGITVTGEVLRRGPHTTVLHTANQRSTILSNLIAVVTKRTLTDNGVLGVVVHVDGGGIVDMHTYAAELIGHCATNLVDHLLVRERAELHIAGELRQRVETHRSTPLAVDTDHHRDTRLLLELVHLVGVLLHTNLHNNQTADAILLDHLLDLALGGVVTVVDNEELSDLVAHRHFAHHTLNAVLLLSKCTHRHNANH